MRGMEIVLIAAMAANRVIGRGNRLPWVLPEDLQYFKRMTFGHYLIMGRKTYESIGRPLPGRTTIIISRKTDYAPAGCLVANSLEEALAKAAGQQRVFVVGGADVYRQALPLAHVLLLTEIATEVEGDAWFPQLVPAEWQEVSRDAYSSPEYSFAFVAYRRRAPA